MVCCHWSNNWMQASKTCSRLHLKQTSFTKHRQPQPTGVVACWHLEVFRYCLTYGADWGSGPILRLFKCWLGMCYWERSGHAKILETSHSTTVKRSNSTVLPNYQPFLFLVSHFFDWSAGKVDEPVAKGIVEEGSSCCRRHFSLCTFCSGSLGQKHTEQRFPGKGRKMLLKLDAISLSLFVSLLACLVVFGTVILVGKRKAFVWTWRLFGGQGGSQHSQGTEERNGAELWNALKCSCSSLNFESSDLHIFFLCGIQTAIMSADSHRFWRGCSLAKQAHAEHKMNQDPLRCHCIMKISPSGPDVFFPLKADGSGFERWHEPWCRREQRHWKTAMVH